MEATLRGATFLQPILDVDTPSTLGRELIDSTYRLFEGTYTPEQACAMLHVPVPAS